MSLSFEIKNLTFFYPNAKTPALDNICLDIGQGEYVCVIGKSGSGKSTLLRCLKPALTPHGKLSGNIFFGGKPLSEISEYDKASKIGFVSQNPENQTITATVRHELAFGLENLGLEKDKIRMRVAETAGYFGISEWFDAETDSLSGGQKQILALAAASAMKPDALILDEPCAMLDPIAASSFLAALKKLRRELGITVIISEHRLDEILPDCDRTVLLDGGKILADQTPHKAVSYIFNENHEMSAAMPVPSKLWNAVGDTLLAPSLTVREGKELLTDKVVGLPNPNTSGQIRREASLTAEGLWFRYEKAAPDVLKGTDFKAYKGEMYMLLGANGAGKSTLLKAFAGAIKPYRGKIKKQGKAVLLPQNPLSLFLYSSVMDELNDVAQSNNTSDSGLYEIIKFCRLENLSERHPYDLSGGERQRLGLAMALLAKPEILLLDEPTKGFDAFFKAELGTVLKKLCRDSGLSVIMASHDIEFGAEYSDRCGLFFDGEIVTENDTRGFFSGNVFYTTAAGRIMEGFLTAEEIIKNIERKK